MDTASSPAITQVSGGYEIAYSTNGDELSTDTSGTIANLGEKVEPGTSPSSPMGPRTTPTWARPAAPVRP